MVRDLAYVEGWRVCRFRRRVVGSSGVIEDRDNLVDDDVVQEVENVVVAIFGHGHDELRKVGKGAGVIENGDGFVVDVKRNGHRGFAWIARESLHPWLCPDRVVGRDVGLGGRGNAGRGEKHGRDVVRCRD